jgi:hypothetical protein
MSVTCSYVAASGKSCTQTTGLLPGVDNLPLCAWHDPARASARRAAHRRGEKARESGATETPPLTMADLPIQEVNSLDDAERLARWAVLQTAIGRLHPRAAMAVAGLCREYRMVHAEASAQQRIRELEAQIKASNERKKS